MKSKRITISRKRLECLLEIEEKYNKLISNNGMIWKDEDVAYLIKAWGDGESTAQEVADFLGRSKNAVIKQVLELRKKGAITHRLRGWSPSDIEFLKRYYHRMPSKEIGEILGRTDLAVQQQARKQGLSRNLKSVDIVELKKLAEDGLTRAEIAKELGCHYDTVKRLVKKHGIVVVPSQKPKEAHHRAMQWIYPVRK